ITWRQLYYRANILRFSDLDPLPRHILEPKLRADKAGFSTGPEWTTDWIGSGPFRLERWELGSRVIARAFADWVLGPPKIATLDIRFIPDPNTIVANLLAGELDVSGSGFIRAVNVASARDQWVGGNMGTLQLSSGS